MISRANIVQSKTRPGHCSGRVFFRFAVSAALASVCAIVSLRAHATDATHVRIVLATPLSGPHAAIGLAQRAALEEAVARLNTKGGIAGRAVALSVHDDGCRRETAALLARTLTTPSTPLPLAVIGHPCASAAETAAPVYQQAGVLLLAAGNRHPALTGRRAGSLIFRVAGRDDRQGSDAARRLRELAGKGGGVTILHDRTAMARAIVGSAARALMSGAPGGTSPPPSIGIVAGETDYTKAVREVSAARPSAILFAGFPAEAAILLRQLRAAGVTAPLLMIDAAATPEMAAHAGALLDERVEVMLPVPACFADADLANGEPALSLQAIAARDAATALGSLADAAHRTPSLVSVDLAQALAALEHRTDPMQPLQPMFDAEGDASTASFAPFRWRNGAWHRIR